MKKRFLKAFLLIAIGLAVTCLTGCARVDTYVLESEDGSILECVTVSLDKTAISSVSGENYKLENIKADIEETAINVIREIKSGFNSKCELSGYVDFIDGIEVGEAYWQNDKFFVSAKFKNIYVYNFYHYGEIEVEGGEPEYDEQPFYTDMVYYYRPTLRRGREYSILTILFERFKIKYPLLLNSSSNELTYTYVSDYRRAHSDADYIYQKDGKYYHVWSLDKIYDTDGDLKGYDVNKTLMVYYRIANKANWMAVCIIIGLSVTLVLLLICLIIDINKNRKNKTKLVNSLSNRKKNDKNQ